MRLSVSFPQKFPGSRGPLQTISRRWEASLLTAGWPKRHGIRIRYLDESGKSQEVIFCDIGRWRYRREAIVPTQSLVLMQLKDEARRHKVTPMDPDDNESLLDAVAEHNPTSLDWDIKPTCGELRRQLETAFTKSALIKRAVAVYYLIATIVVPGYLAGTVALGPASLTNAASLISAAFVFLLIFAPCSLIMLIVSTKTVPALLKHLCRLADIQTLENRDNNIPK